MSKKPMTKKQIRIARTIARKADIGGTVQVLDIIDLQQRGIIPGDPCHATTMSIDRAWEIAGLDPQQCREYLFG